MLFLLAPACRAQGDKPPDYASKPLEKWIEALNDKDPTVRYQARQALGPKGPYAKVAVAALIDALAHNQSPSEEAIRTPADYGLPVVATLVRALKRPEALARAGVAEALGFVTARPAEAVPALGRRD